MHRPKRVVLTGGPGAGKTAVLEMLAHEVCRHVVISREAAGILFAGGFPRGDSAAMRRGLQRAIYHVQLEIETVLADANPAVMLLDRGIVDGGAYWPGPDDFWTAVGTTREQALARYDAVIHLRSPNGANGYGHQNPFRIETAAEARVIDGRVLEAWRGHPNRYVIDSSPDFLVKAERALALVRAQIPTCCANQPATTSTGHPAPAITEPTTLPSMAGMTRPIP
jgi:predicted ATPase